MRAIVISGRNGVIIGENSIIGAGSLVTRSVPNNFTAIGVPARGPLKKKR